MLQVKVMTRFVLVLVWATISSVQFSSNVRAGVKCVSVVSINIRCGALLGLG